MGLAFNILGLVGSFMISASLVPQIVKVYRTKSAKDLSRSFQLLYVVGLILVAVYGLGESLWPIWIPVVIELAGGLTLLVMKFIYDRREPKYADGHLDLESAAQERGIATSYKYALTPK
ncbi:Acyl-CoA dehydrogenase family member 10 [Phytophthora cinnamomi]|uniref:Acyl-CoA dehydrogenase family member 10 n=1 Tax=Phytophthora cinnamomi TaxID=4785 RepID=UPI003559CC0D|nr:Acyl-CoA dehydrogenase family member 10 [Phytophthora cinnamomi]